MMTLTEAQAAYDKACAASASVLEKYRELRKALDRADAVEAAALLNLQKAKQGVERPRAQVRVEVIEPEVKSLPEGSDE